MVRATHPALYLTHARAFATHRCGVDGGARDRRAAGAAEREDVCRVCQAGRRRRGRRQQRGRTSVRGRRARRRHGLREGVDGLFNDWRRLKRARTELIGVSETVPTSAPSQAAGRRRALPLALVISASEVTRRRPASSSSVNLPLSLPQSPHSLRVSVLDAGRSRADFLFVVRVALIGRDRPSTSHLLLLRGHVPVGQHLTTCRL